MQRAKAQVERGQDNFENWVAEDDQNDVFVAHFQDRIAEIDRKIVIVQKSQQENHDRIKTCEAEARESDRSSSISETKKLQIRVESLKEQLDRLKGNEEALLLEKVLMQKLLAKQIRLRRDQISSNRDEIKVAYSQGALLLSKGYVRFFFCITRMLKIIELVYDGIRDYWKHWALS